MMLVATSKFLVKVKLHNAGKALNTISGHCIRFISRSYLKKKKRVYGLKENDAVAAGGLGVSRLSTGVLYGV